MNTCSEARCLLLQYEGWQKACAGLAKGLAPRLAAAGCGGSYFLPDDKGQNVAVFKPTDEEPCAINNPRENGGLGSTGGSTCACASADGYGPRKGICPGEGAVREVGCQRIKSVSRMQLILA